MVYRTCASIHNLCILCGIGPVCIEIQCNVILNWLSFIQALDTSSGKDITSTESSFTGSGKTSGQVKDGDTEKRTGTSEPNKTGSTRQDLHTPSQKELWSYSKGDILSGKDDLKTDLKGHTPSALSKEDGEDGLKTWEQLWNEDAIPPDLDLSIDVNDYYTYDYFEDAEDDDDDDNGGFSVTRSKKDTSSSQGNSQTLDHLAELVTGANPPMDLVNFGAPNPDIEITIEVVNVDDVTQDGVVISMDVTDDSLEEQPSRERGNKETQESDQGGRPKGKDKVDRGARPTSETDAEESNDQPRWSSFELAPGIPDPTRGGFKSGKMNNFKA